MALVTESENTTTPIVGTETQLAAPTTTGVRVLRVDLGNLTGNLDAVTLRVKSKVRTAGTVRDQYYLMYPSNLGMSIVETPPITADLGATFTLTQTAGVAKAFDWEILNFLTATVESENTLTPVVNTPAQLAAPTTNKTRVLRLDFGNFVNGDYAAVQVTEKVRSTGTVRTLFYQVFGNAMTAPVVETAPISARQGATFTVTQIAGVAKTIDWKILTLD
jgi:hypothetical protein